MDEWKVPKLKINNLGRQRTPWALFVRGLFCDSANCDNECETCMFNAPESEFKLWLMGKLQEGE